MPGRAWLPGCRAGGRGSTGPGGFSFLVAGMIPAGQPDGRAWSRLIAAVISRVQGQRSASRSRRRRPPRTSRPATAKIRSRSRLGSQRRAGPARASICVQASRSQASATISHQSWFCANPFSGRLRRPVSLAQRILAACPAAVPELQVRELPAFRAGGQAGEPVPVDVGEPQLRPGMRALLADDDPHSRGPAVQVEHAGDLGDPGAVPWLAVCVIGLGPCAGGPGARSGRKSARGRSGHLPASRAARTG